MASKKVNKIKPVHTQAADTISDSRVIINENFDVLANAVNELKEWSSSDAVNNYYPEGLEWETGGKNGPIPHIVLHEHPDVVADPIPAAGVDCSGVLTTANQSIAGLKKFVNGVLTDALKTTSGSEVFTYVEENGSKRVYIGGKSSGLYIKLKNDGTFDSWGFPSTWANSIISSTDVGVRIDGLAKRIAEINKEEDKLLDNLATVNKNISNIQTQIDNEVTNWFGECAPGSSVEPESNWTTDKLRDEHLGDTYTDTEHQQSYKYAKKNDQYGNEVYYWNEITQPDVVKMLLEAQKAVAAADGKITTYIGAPKEDNDDYGVGDLWIASESDVTSGLTVDGVPVVAGFIYHCWRPRTDKETGVKHAFTTADFDSVVRYTDDTAANRAEESIKALNDDTILTPYEKSSLLDTIYELTGSRTYMLFASVITNTTNTGSLQELYNRAKVIKDAEDAASESESIQPFIDAVQEAYDNLVSYMIIDLQVFGEGAKESTKNFNKTYLLSKFNALYKAINNLEHEVTESNLTLSSEEIQNIIDEVEDRIKDIDSDNNIDALERDIIINEWYKISGSEEFITADNCTGGSYHSVVTDMTSNGVSTDTLKTAYNALRDYLNSLGSPISNGTETFDRSVLRQKLNAYYIAEENAKKAVRDKKISAVDAESYLKNAIESGDTEINGGLVLTNILEVKGYSEDEKESVVTGGICGINTNITEDKWDGKDDQLEAARKNTKNIGLWLGGTFQEAIDGVRTITNGKRPEGVTTIANVVLGKDGAGYLAGGNISWGIDGSGTLAGGNISWDDKGSASFNGNITIGKSTIYLKTDGSGRLANGNISWDKNGVANYSGNINIGTKSGSNYPIELKTDGSGRLAGGNFSWDTNGDITLTGEIEAKTFTLSPSIEEDSTFKASFVFENVEIEAGDEILCPVLHWENKDGKYSLNLANIVNVLQSNIAGVEYTLLSGGYYETGSTSFTKKDVYKGSDGKYYSLNSQNKLTPLTGTYYYYGTSDGNNAFNGNYHAFYYYDASHYIMVPIGFADRIDFSNGEKSNAPSDMSSTSNTYLVFLKGLNNKVLDDGNNGKTIVNIPSLSWVDIYSSSMTVDASMAYGPSGEKLTSGNYQYAAGSSTHTVLKLRSNSGNLQLTSSKVNSFINTSKIPTT